jgi:hypothetical protein
VLRQPAPHPRRDHLQERLQLATGRRRHLARGRRRRAPQRRAHPVPGGPAHGRLLRDRRGAGPRPLPPARRGAAGWPRAERGRVERPQHGAWRSGLSDGCWDLGAAWVGGGNGARVYM